MPLERGIATSKSAGTPISAKYELEDGKLQLSVYTAKGDSFSEVTDEGLAIEDGFAAARLRALESWTVPRLTGPM